MSVVQIGHGESSFLMECSDCNLPSQEPRRATVPTKIGNGQIDDITEQVFEKVGVVASIVMENAKKGMCNLTNVPKECELELCFAITTTGKILILTGETEMGIKLRLKW